jgi:hypothetical protein
MAHSSTWATAGLDTYLGQCVCKMKIAVQRLCWWLFRPAVSRTMSLTPATQVAVVSLGFHSTWMALVLLYAGLFCARLPGAGIAATGMLTLRPKP